MGRQQFAQCPANHRRGDVITHDYRTNLRGQNQGEFALRDFLVVRHCRDYVLSFQIVNAGQRTELIDAEPDGLWQEFVMREVVRTEQDNDLSSFVDLLRREAWVLGDRHVRFQAGVIQQAVLHDHEAFIT